MLQNYFKIATRNLFRQRTYSVINIAGLAIGLTVSLLILLWVQHERSIDQFHENGDRIFQVYANMKVGDGSVQTWSSLPFPASDYLLENFPEIEKTAAYDPTNKKNFKTADTEILIDGIYATASFMDIFSFPFLELEAPNFFDKPNGVLLSEESAEKLFGKDWAGNSIGKTISIDGQKDFKVSGIFENSPDNSSMKFDFVLNLLDLRKADPTDTPWGNFDSQIMIAVKEDVNSASLAEKIAPIVKDNNEYADQVSLILQPFEAKYLRGRYENGKIAGGRIEYVRIFTLSALFLLLIACINFMNLATARASLRAKEVGVRKTIGANRGALMKQFMVEALVITALSFVIAILLGELLLPYFHDITGKNIRFDFTSPAFWGLIALLAFGTALLSGSYPAFFLSSFNIVNVLKGKLKGHFGGESLRKGLVVFQFMLSILLIVSALVVTNQVSYLKNKNLGLNKDHVLYFRTPPAAKKQLQTFEHELSKIEGVQQITKTNTNPLNVGSQTGDPKWEGMAVGQELLFNVISTDESFLPTMDIELVEGRNFSANLSTDSMSFLLNETAVNAMNLENPIGKSMEFWGNRGTIVGVVKDFHIHSLHFAMEPLVIANLPSNTRLTMLKVNPEKTEAVIAAVGQTFQKFAEGRPYRYDFLDERYRQMYRSEQRTSTLSNWFAMIALFISCLGLFGLSAFIAEQKTKEIGIRKVLGASVSNVVFLLSKNFLKLIGFSLLISLPLAWYFMNDWLQDFAYKIDLHWAYFALAGITAIGIAFMTMSFQSVKAALANPIESLRNE